MAQLIYLAAPNYKFKHPYRSVNPAQHFNALNCVRLDQNRRKGVLLTSTADSSLTSLKIFA